MKKLFAFISSVTIEEYTTIHITGPYSLIRLGPDFAEFQCGDHVLSASGTDLIIETLSEETAVFSFEEIQSVTMKKGAPPHA